VLHEAGVDVAETDGMFPLVVIVAVLVTEHPPASVTMTVHVPAEMPVAVEVVCPLHHW
jgi:hypothetical protein